MEISIIAAIAQNSVIGKNNDLIWHLPKDLKFFKKTTKGHPVIMGRKNFESIPEKYRPLPDRENIVLTRQKDYDAKGAYVTSSLKKAIEHVEGNEEIFIIGGGQIYEWAFKEKLVTRMYITEIQESFEGDTFFPQIDYKKWAVQTIESHKSDDKNPHDFVIKQYDLL